MRRFFILNSEDILPSRSYQKIHSPWRIIFLPAYHIDIACFVAEVERKWIDNFLSRVDVAGAESSGHGVVRRLTLGAVRQIALTRRLVQDLGLSIERAASLAGMLLMNRGEVHAPSGVTVRFDLAAFEADIDRRLADGVEAVVLARRGRPPGRPSDRV